MVSATQGEELRAGHYSGPSPSLNAPPSVSINIQWHNQAIIQYGTLALSLGHVTQATPKHGPAAPARSWFSDRNADTAVELVDALSGFPTGECPVESTLAQVFWCT